MALELYTLVVCEIVVPDKAPDIRYIRFADITASMPNFEGSSIIQYLRETNNYSESTKINIKDIIVLTSREEFNKYL